MITVESKKLMKKLSRGAHAEVWAISDFHVAKLFPLGDPSAQEEYDLLKRANAVNGLAVKAINLMPSDGFEFDLLIMERLYPLQPRALTLETRETFYREFLVQLAELHAAGLAHGDIRRDSTQGNPWDNIIPTSGGLRLVDFGIGSQRGDPDFDSVKDQDLRDAKALKDWFLTY